MKKLFAFIFSAVMAVTITAVSVNCTETEPIINDGIGFARNIIIEVSEGVLNLARWAREYFEQYVFIDGVFSAQWLAIISLVVFVGLLALIFYALKIRR